jgi:hypothetical protein
VRLSALDETLQNLQRLGAIHPADSHAEKVDLRDLFGGHGA